MNNTELCRNRLLERLGVCQEPKKRPGLKNEIKTMTNALDSIINLARPRLIMGGIRYGSKWEHEPLMNYMQEKFDLYRESGNMEMLVDLVNFCAIESSLKTHPKFHFDAKDRK